MPKLEKKDAQELLRRYRLGLCTEREIEMINHWYESLGDGKRSEEISDNDEVHDDMLEAITGRIDAAEGKIPIRKMYFPVRLNLRRMAAVLIAGIGLALFFYIRHDKGMSLSEAPVVKESGAILDPSAIYLSDGSVVWLKGESTLNFPGTFEGSTREVTLSGEAFFEIAKDHNKPFIIHSSRLTTRVLGTSFNIRDVEHADSVEVAVMTGKVAVSVKKTETNEPDEIILTPNQKAVYSRKKNLVVQTTEDEIRNFKSITENKFAFVDVPLATIVLLLNDRYDVAIALENENMKDCVITADLSAESLLTSLEVLAKVTGGEYQVIGESIFLKGPGCVVKQ